MNNDTHVLQQQRFYMINVSLISLIFGSYVWAFKGPKAKA